MKHLVFLLLFCVVTLTAAETDMHMTIQQVKEKHQAKLMALPGVVSIGIGLFESETVIKIGLDGKYPDTEKVLPKELEGYKVISQTVGTIKVQ